MTKVSALIGMSGGVDSSVAAFLTRQEGLHCIGATMQLHDPSRFRPESSGTCGGISDVEDARAVAAKLGMEHFAFDFQEEFDRQVIDKFVSCYETGLTPNPCIDCNRYLKFGHLVQKALTLGCDYVVSGHYAQIRQDPDSGRFILYKAHDTGKDQTYFLYNLTQEQLAHIRFPLGGLTKQQVRQIAQEQGFVNARKRDSQDICFVPDGDYFSFLERYTGKTYPQGDFLDLNGKVLGRHKGAPGYTLGQRKGLGLAMGAPVYVCRKDMAANTVTVGPNEALFTTALTADNCNWFPFPSLSTSITATAKIRHSQFEQECTVYPTGDGSIRVEFRNPQRAVTPGQAIVLYDGDMVIGGGTITAAL